MHCSLLFVLCALLATATALEGAKYREKFDKCGELCEIYSKEECPRKIERCQYLARGHVYDDCMDEEEACVEAGKDGCYKAFLGCVAAHAQD